MNELFTAVNPTERSVFQHYEIERRPGDGKLCELGRGAMGITYKAIDTNLRVPVALKIIAHDLLPDARARARFLREARAAAQLRHTNVAAVYHLGQEADAVFYTMEFIEGETVESLVRRLGPLEAPPALRIAGQVARALQAAHARGLLHRDLKPSNLMVTREHENDDELLVKVIDFGLVKPLEMSEDEGTAAVSMSRGMFLGTPLYASPEQCAQEETLDGRADLYSLGATLWFLLVGDPPFRGTARTVIAQHLSKPPPFELISDQPPTVVELLRALLAKDPADRLADAATLRAQITAILRDLERTDSHHRGSRSVGAQATAIAAPPVLPGAAVPPPLPPLSAEPAGFSLAALLRQRGKIPPSETRLLLFLLAALVDDAIADAWPVQLSPAGIHVRFPSDGEGTVAADARALLAAPLEDWPPFDLEIAPASADQDRGDGLGDPARVEALANTLLRGFAALAYELLSGSAPAASASGGFRPLAELPEASNALIREALDPAVAPAYPSAAAFAIALAASLARAQAAGSGLLPPAGVAAPAGAAPSPEGAGDLKKDVRGWLARIFG